MSAYLTNNLSAGENRCSIRLTGGNVLEFGIFVIQSHACANVTETSARIENTQMEYVLKNAICNSIYELEFLYTRSAEVENYIEITFEMPLFRCKTNEWRERKNAGKREWHMRVERGMARLPPSFVCAIRFRQFVLRSANSPFAWESMRPHRVHRDICEIGNWIAPCHMHTSNS